MDLPSDNTHTISENEELSVMIKDLSEQFTIYSHKADSIKERILKGVSIGRGEKKEVWALKNITLNIPRGKVIGIIGENGSGKTTLLKLIAGILKPDKGELKVNGSIAAILQLGVGFQRDLSGRDNVYLNSAMLGISKKIIDERIGEIIRFAELENFIDMPLKTYSSGMEMRLGFSIAANVDPDILLIDEVLIIGDEAFQRKCLRHIEQCKSEGKTIILVSHSMNLIQEICDQTYLLRQGRLIAGGDTREVINYYYQTCGVREGIGIIKNQDWEVIFNNGHIYLLYRQKPLTVDPGLFFSFEWEAKTIYSFSAEWKIVSCTETSCSARGYCAAADTHISWSMECREDGTIDYTAEVERESAGVTLQGHFMSSYDMWYAHAHTGYVNGPHLYKNENIHTQLLQPGQQCGFGYETTPAEALPAFVCAFSQVADVSFLFTGDEPHEQVMSVSSVNSAKLAGCLSIADSDIHVRAERDREKSSIRGEFLSVFIDEHKKKIYVSSGNKVISHAEGIFTALFCDDVWINLSQFDWRIEKPTAAGLVLIAESKSIALSQHITFSIQDDRLTVNTRIVSPAAVISEAHMNLLCEEMFSRWFFDFTAGEFTEKPLGTWKQVSVPVVKRPFLFALGSDNDDMVLVYSQDGSPENKMMLYDADHFGQTRVISLVRTQLPIELSFQLRVFDGSAFDRLQWGYYCISAVMLIAKLIRCGIFCEETGLLFCADGFYFIRKNKVVTPGEGLQVTCYGASRRVSSRDAVWTIEKKSECELFCRGIVPNSAIVFTFDFALRRDHICPRVHVFSSDGSVVRDIVLSLPVSGADTHWRYNLDSGQYTPSENHPSEHEIPIPNALACELFSLAAPDHEDGLVITKLTHAAEARLSLYAIRHEDTYLMISYALASLRKKEHLSFEVAFMADSSLHEQTRALAQKRTITCADLRMSFEAQRVRLFCRGKDLLSAPGIYAVITGDDYAYDTKTFEWTYEKISHNSMKALARHLQLTFCCTWVITLHESGIEISAEHETAPALAWSQTQFVFTFDQSYAEWFYNLKSGSCRGVNETRHWQELPLPNQEPVEYCALCAEDHDYPDILYVPGESGFEGRLYLNNALQPEPSRALSQISSQRGHVQAFRLLFHIALHGEVRDIYALLVIKESVLRLYELVAASIVVDDMAVIFSSGIFRIIYRGHELTHPAGIRTLFLNRDGVWVVPEVSSNTCQREGMNRLIVTMHDDTYLLEVGIEKNRVFFIVKKAAEKSTQCNFIMPLADHYDRWFFNREGAVFGARTGGALREQIFSFTPDQAVVYGLMNTDSLPGCLFEQEESEAGEIKFRTTPQAKQIETTIFLRAEEFSDRAVFSFSLLPGPDAAETIATVRAIVLVLHPALEAAATFDCLMRVFITRIFPLLDAAVIVDSFLRVIASDVQPVLFWVLQGEEFCAMFADMVIVLVHAAEQVHVFQNALSTLVFPALIAGLDTKKVKQALSETVLPALQDVYLVESCRVIVADIIIPALHARLMIEAYRNFSALLLPALEGARLVESLKTEIEASVLPFLDAAHTVEACYVVIEQVFIPSLQARAMIVSYRAFTDIFVPVLEGARAIEAYRIFFEGLITYLHSLVCGEYTFVFGSGPVHIFKGLKQITRRKGLNVSFIFSEKKYDADDFQWTCERIDRDTILYVGMHEFLPLRQSLRFAGAPERMHVLYSISTAADVASLSDFYVDCMVSDEYSEWIMNDRSKCFEKVRGNHVFENVPGGYLDGADVVGVIGSPDGSILFSEFSNKKFHPTVLNWQKDIACRSIKISREQVLLKPKAELSFAIAFVSDEAAKNVQRTEMMKRQIKTENTSLYCDNKKVLITHKGRPITTDSGIASILRVGEKEYHSLRSTWSMREKTERSIVTETIYPIGKQIIRWSFPDDDTVEGELSFETESLIDIDDLQVFIFLENGFLNHSVITRGATRALPSAGAVNERETGPFCLALCRDEEPIMLGLCSDLSEPIVYEMDDASGGEYKLIKLHKTMNTDESLRFRFYFSPKNHTHFDPYQISRDTLLFYADVNEHALLWKEKKLTQAMGLYSTYYHADYGWCDSIHHARRQCRKVDDEQLEIICSWKQLGIEQHWSVQLLTDSVLEWSVWVQVSRKIFFEKEQINVMLSPHYVYWSSAEGHGDFPDTFTAAVGSDWDLLFKTTSRATPFAFSAQKEKPMLPQIVITPTLFSDGWELSVVNSDELFSGRVLRAFRSGALQLEPGTYEYCRIRCQIEERD
jgi:ABC-type polysaccharide/polyol phosphate transport system ATPase subunit